MVLKTTSKSAPSKHARPETSASVIEEYEPQT